MKEFWYLAIEKADIAKEKNSHAMYIIKIQGTKKIPDFVQIRDDDFTLIAYFRINNPRQALNRCHLIDKQDDIIDLVKKLPYGKIQKLEV